MSIFRDLVLGVIGFVICIMWTYVVIMMYNKIGYKIDRYLVVKYDYYLFLQTLIFSFIGGIGITGQILIIYFIVTI